jgi:hypothetical protein
MTVVATYTARCVENPYVLHANAVTTGLNPAVTNPHKRALLACTNSVVEFGLV